MDYLDKGKWSFVVAVFAFLMSVQVVYAGQQYITVNDAKHIELGEKITKVFISDPDIVDYNVINESTIVVFAKAVGQARLMVYGESEKLLMSDRIIADLDLSQIRRQIGLHFPGSDVKIESVGNQVAVSGVVESEQTRDDIYRMVANLLGRDKIEKYNKAQKLKFQTSGVKLEEPESMIFERNMTWEGIIERLQVATVQQVNVKISVAQVTERFAETVGVDWSSIGANVGQFLFQQFEAADLTTLITALGNENVAQVLAEPNLTVISGESASF